jgi:hypothetical protein
MAVPDAGKPWMWRRAECVHFPGQAFKTYRLGGKMSELLYSPAAYGIDLSHKDMPRPRARSR